MGPVIVLEKYFCLSVAAGTQVSTVRSRRERAEQTDPATTMYKATRGRLHEATSLRDLMAAEEQMVEKVSTAAEAAVVA